MIPVVRVNDNMSIKIPCHNKINYLQLQTEGEDELKKRQLMELAIINGTYRDSSQRNSK